MDNDLPYGSDSGNSLFGKIKERLSGIPTYLLAFLAVFAATLILGAFYILLSPNISLKDLFNRAETTEEANGEKNISVPYKSTSKPLATGKQTYSISGKTEGAPIITEAVIDPIDPALGANQTWTVRVLDLQQKSVKEVSLTLTTDNGKGGTYKLTKIEGTETDGRWQVFLKMPDSYKEVYQAKITATNVSNLGHSVTLTFR